MKALVMTQLKVVPDASTMFLASLSVMVRFGVSALVLFCFCLPHLKQLTKLEISQGLGLGIIGGIGLLLQMDGVNYTTASTSAFLTQCYCLFIPLVVALRERRWPSPIILISSGLVPERDCGSGEIRLARNATWPWRMGNDFGNRVFYGTDSLAGASGGLKMIRTDGRCPLNSPRGFPFVRRWLALVGKSFGERPGRRCAHDNSRGSSRRSRRSAARAKRGGSRHSTARDSTRRAGPRPVQQTRCGCRRFRAQGGCDGRVVRAKVPATLLRVRRISGSPGVTIACTASRRSPSKR